MIPFPKSALLLFAYMSCNHAGYTKAFSHIRVSNPAVNQFGRWEIAESNDPLVATLPSPRIVDIYPGGFRIGKAIFGGFDMEPSPAACGGIFVSMTLFHLKWMRRTYALDAVHPDRIALFGTGRHASTYYILRRWPDGDKAML